MKEKAFRIGMWLLVLLGIGASAFVLSFTNPYQDLESFEKNFLNVVTLYLGMGLFFTGLFTLILFWIRKKSLLEEDVQHIHMGVSFRQGMLLSIAVIVVLVLQSFRVLVWWDALLAIGAIMMIELYFLAR